MKFIIHKFRAFLDKEFEIPLPKKKPKHQPIVKPPSNYVNPFKHQQEIRHVAPPVKPIVKAVNPQPSHSKKPTLLDKKFEFTIKKPKFNFNKLNIKKPAINIKTPHIQRPHIEMPKIVRPQITLPPKPKLSAPKINNPFKRSKKQYAIFGVISLGIFMFWVFAFSGFTLPSQTNAPKTTETAQSAAEIEAPAAKVAEAVGKKITLPKDEDPVSATVSDREKLQDQDFFKKAQNGDKILMYKKSKKAYLYRPSTDEVIAIAPLEFQDVAGAATEKTETAPAPTDDPDAPKVSIEPEPPHGKVLVPGRY